MQRARISSRLNLIDFIEILRQCSVWNRPDTKKPLFPSDFLCPLASLVRKEQKFWVRFLWFCVSRCCHVFLVSGVVAGFVSMKVAAQ